jgi:hypothetical protein
MRRSSRNWRTSVAGREANSSQGRLGQDAGARQGRPGGCPRLRRRAGAARQSNGRTGATLSGRSRSGIVGHGSTTELGKSLRSFPVTSDCDRASFTAGPAVPTRAQTTGRTVQPARKSGRIRRGCPSERLEVGYRMSRPGTAITAPIYLRVLRFLGCGTQSHGQLPTAWVENCVLTISLDPGSRCAPLALRYSLPCGHVPHLV